MKWYGWFLAVMFILIFLFGDKLSLVAWTIAAAYYWWHQSA